MSAKKPRRQCAKCPWRVDVDPNDIPNGYCKTKHANLKNTIAVPGDLSTLRHPLRLMACHESSIEKSIPCVGWLVNQLSTGNNIALRLKVLSGQIDANVVTVGEQHRRLEDTLPEDG